MADGSTTQPAGTAAVPIDGPICKGRARSRRLRRCPSVQLPRVAAPALAARSTCADDGAVLVALVTAAPKGSGEKHADAPQAMGISALTESQPTFEAVRAANEQMMLDRQIGAAQELARE